MSTIEIRVVSTVLRKWIVIDVFSWSTVYIVLYCTKCFRKKHTVHRFRFRFRFPSIDPCSSVHLPFGLRDENIVDHSRAVWGWMSPGGEIWFIWFIRFITMIVHGKSCVQLAASYGGWLTDWLYKIIIFLRARSHASRYVCLCSVSFYGGLQEVRSRPRQSWCRYELNEDEDGENLPSMGFCLKFSRHLNKMNPFGCGVWFHRWYAEHVRRGGGGGGGGGGGERRTHQ